MGNSTSVWLSRGVEEDLTPFIIVAELDRESVAGVPTPPIYGPGFWTIGIVLKFALEGVLDSEVDEMSCGDCFTKLEEDRTAFAWRYGLVAEDCETSRINFVVASGGS